MRITQRVDMQAGYILHQYPYRNSSAILEVMTRDHGRIGLVARGARGNRARWRGLLMAFRPLLFSFSGRGELRTVTAVEPGGSSWVLQGTCLVCGLYLNELLMRLLHRHDPEPAVFSFYEQAVRRLATLGLDGLEARGETVEKELRYFELQLLQALGYGLILDHEVGTGIPLLADRIYDYRIDHGPVDAGGLAGFLGVPVHGATLESLRLQALAGAEQLKEAKLLMRALLAVHLGDKPLYSRQLLKSATPALSAGS